MKLYKSAFLLIVMIVILVFSGCSDEEVSTGSAILSSDSILANLVVSPTNIASYLAGTTYYSVTVANEVSSIDITATTNDGYQR